MSNINDFDEEKKEEIDKPQENKDFQESFQSDGEENKLEGYSLEEVKEMENLSDDIQEESFKTGSNSGNSSETDYKEIPKDEFYKEDVTKQPNQAEKKNHRKIGRGFSYIAVGLVCAIIGGISGSVSTYYLNNKKLSTETKINTSTSSDNTVQNSTASAQSTSSTSASTSGTELTVPDVVSKVSSAIVGISITTYSGSGYGSGIIISQDGYILTNYHVISSANSITVDYTNGKTSAAKVVNYDSSLDVAVIKVTDKSNIPAVAELGDSSKLRVGDTAIAFGSPLGKQLQNSVTVGVISALDRDIQMENESQKLIQTDAAINEGNSGGALVNTKGQVIGINVAKIGSTSSSTGSRYYDQSSTSVEGLGFAIPINEVKPKINDLLKPLLLIGIEGRDITDDMSKTYNIPVGVYVLTVQEFSPAELSGMEKGDVIISFDGIKVTTISQLNSLKLKHKAGDKVKIVIIRDGNQKTLTLTFKTSE